MSWALYSARIPSPNDCSFHFSLFICPSCSCIWFFLCFSQGYTLLILLFKWNLVLPLFLYFVLGYPQFTNNVVIVPGGQQRDSAIHTHVSVLFQTPLPSRLPHNIEQSSMCYTIDPSSLSILKIAICFYPDSYSLEWGKDFNADTSPSASSTYLSDCSFL